MENSMKGYQKIKIYRYHMIQQFYFWIFFQRKKKPTNPKNIYIYMYTYVHCSIIYSSQYMETN